VNRGTMGVNSLPKTVTRQRRDCDLNPGPTAPESSRLGFRVNSWLRLSSGSRCPVEGGQMSYTRRPLQQP